MIRADLYKQLVPDAPPFRRYQGDIPVAGPWKTRVFNNAFLEVATPKLDRPQLVSTCQGSIEKILFAFPDWAASDAMYAAAYKSLIEALRRGTKFVVVHQSSSRPLIESWFTTVGHAAAEIEFVELPNYVAFSDWAEDAYVSVIDTDTNDHYLLEPWQFFRGGDALIADAVESSTVSRATQVPLMFQGGNCLIADDVWMLGKDYFVDTLDLLTSDRPPIRLPDGVDHGTFVRQLYKDYIDITRELLVVGVAKAIPLADLVGTKQGAQFYLDLPAGGAGTFQPIFHIDMFITPLATTSTGSRRILVGDPRLADRLLGAYSPFALSDAYDAIASDLSNAGFDVIRNPLVHQPVNGQIYRFGELRALADQEQDEALLKAVGELKAVGAEDATPVAVREWHHVTWNNCLVESSSRYGNHVYMPTFGHGANATLAALDDHMREIWEGLGYEVHPLGDFNPFAARSGVVHCIKK